MTKKILTMLIVIAMMFTVLPVMAFAGEAEGENASGGGDGTPGNDSSLNSSFDSDAHVDSLVKAADAAADAAKEAEKALDAIAGDAKDASDAAEDAKGANDAVSANFNEDGTPTGSAGDKVDEAEDALGDANSAIGDATDVASAKDAIDAVNDAADAVNDVIEDVDAAVENAGKAATAAEDAIKAANSAIDHASEAINEASRAMMAAQDADEAYSALLQDAVDNDDAGALTALAEAENELNNAWGTYIDTIQNAAELVRDAAEKAAEAQQSAADARKAYEDAYNAIMRDTISASEQKWQDLEALRENARKSAMDAYESALAALKNAMDVKAMAEEAKGFADSANLKANKAVDWLEDWLENDVEIETLKANLKKAVDTVNDLGPPAVEGSVSYKITDGPIRGGGTITTREKIKNGDVKVIAEGITATFIDKTVTVNVDSNLIGTFVIYISAGNANEFYEYTFTITGTCKKTFEIGELGNYGHVYLGDKSLTKPEVEPITYELNGLHASPNPRGNNEWKEIYGPSGFEIIGDPVIIDKKNPPEIPDHDPPGPDPDPPGPDPEPPGPGPGPDPEPPGPGPGPGPGPVGGGGRTSGYSTYLANLGEITTIPGVPVPLAETVTIEDEEVPLGGAVTIIDENVPLGELPTTGGSGVPGGVNMVRPHAALDDERRKLLPDLEDSDESDD